MAFELDGYDFLHSARLGRLKRYLASHYDERVTLEQAARVAALEPTYFSKFFRRQAGVCFSDWVRCVRVGAALRLMGSEDQTVIKIAFAVGFTSVRSFERACLRFTGECPRALLRLARIDTAARLSTRHAPETQ